MIASRDDHLKDINCAMLRYHPYDTGLKEYINTKLSDSLKLYFRAIFSNWCPEGKCICQHCVEAEAKFAADRLRETHL
jgi:hypothetical protein